MARATGVEIAAVGMPKIPEHLLDSSQESHVQHPIMALVASDRVRIATPTFWSADNIQTSFPRWRSSPSWPAAWSS